MTARTLRQILRTLQKDRPSNTLSSQICDACGEANHPVHAHPEPVWGQPGRQLIHFTCSRCGFYQEDVV